MGSTVFRHKLLERHGSVVAIPHSKLISNTKNSAAYIKTSMAA